MKKITLLFTLLLGVFATSYGQYSLCADAVPVTLPYTHTDNTANYADTNYEGSPGATGCGTTNTYLNGNDVVYAFTAPSSNTMKLTMTTTGTWSGMFVYSSCTNIGASCIAGGRNTGAGGVTLPAVVVTAGQTYYVVISTWAAPQSIPYTLNIVENTCTSPTATYGIVSDCVNGPQFFVDVNITNIGSATSLTVSDNQGSATQPATAAGLYSFGPYANATPVIFTITNDQDSNCIVTSAAQSQTVCPPDCATSPIIVACGDVTTTTLIAGAGAWNVDTCGFDTPGTESMYSFTPPFDGIYSLQLTAATGGYIDYYYKAASGTCDTTGWTCIDDNNAVGIDPIGTLTAGVEYWILLDSEGTTVRTHSFKINCPPTCTPSAATFAVVSDCVNAPQFYVDVNVTNLGSATSLTVSDDQGSATQSASAPGLFTFGPFPNATPVKITVLNDQDATCVITSSTLTLNVCPPANDEPAGASELILDLGTACGPNQINLVSNESTTGSPEVAPTCGNYAPANGSGDIWYKIVVPNPDFKLNLTNVVSISGSFFTVSGELYSGASGSFAAVGTCGNTWPKTYTGLTVGDTYYLRLWDYNTDGIGTFSICGYYLDCVNATATYAVINDCVNAPQFYVDVNVTSLGSATSLTVTDNQGSPAQVVSNTGLVNFGPFPNNTPVIFTIANDQNAVCTITSPTQNQVACPGPNDSLCGAIELIVGTASTGTDYNNLAATAEASEPVPACFNAGINGSVWFSFVAPASGNVIVTTDILGGTLLDTEIAVYDGTGVTCSDLSTLGAALGCDQDGGEIVGFGYTSVLNLPTLTAGNTYYVQVDRWGEAANGTFGIDVIDNDPLANNSFDTFGFIAYPNPVIDILNLSYSKNIDKVQVINLLGQEVNTKSINTSNAKVDMSNLAAGTYLVKVTSDNQVKTLKVIKN